MVELSIELLGYFHILHVAAVNNLNTHDTDDLKDAIVLATCDSVHFTDEQLDEAVDEFCDLQDTYDAESQR